MSHTEPDHSFLVPAVLDLYPEATVVASKVAINFLKGLTNRWEGCKMCCSLPQVSGWMQPHLLGFPPYLDMQLLCWLSNVLRSTFGLDGTCVHACVSACVRARERVCLWVCYRAID